MSSIRETGTILDRILAQTAADVAQRRNGPIPEVVREYMKRRPTPVSLVKALAGPGVSVIAEIKRASPSKGRFPIEVDPAAVALDYIEGGAAAISVLTDGPFFEGSLEDMLDVAEVAQKSDLRPAVLRKDFVVDPIQIIEAFAYGADALLLIVAALTQPALERLVRTTRDHGLEPLVEVHDEREMHRAGLAGARLIGINNRDLRTFEVDLKTTERLAKNAPRGAVVIAESGIFTPDDVRRMGDVGAHAVLVGESLITAPDRVAAVRELTNAVPPG